MRHLARLSIPTIALSLLLAACGSSSNNTTSSASSAAPAARTSGSGVVVKTASGALGTILVTGQGMTLYRLSGEQNGKFICTGACLSVWHPLTVSSGTAPSGEVSSLGIVKRPEGTLQVTYRGAPLYTFAQDQQPGETKGQGIKDVGTWSVITTSSSSTPPSTSSAPPGTSSAPPASSSAPPAPSSNEGGYHY